MADPGVVRVGDSWRAPLPDVMTELLDKGDEKDFDDFMAIGMKDDPDRAAMVPSSTLVEFTEAEGADSHCQQTAHALTTERVFNWLESILA